MNRNAVTVDFHAHAMVEEVEALVRAHPRWSDEMKKAGAAVGEASLRRNRELMGAEWMPRLTGVEHRIDAMDSMGIDLQVVSLVPNQYHYWADLELAEKIVAAANEGIAALCRVHPDRLVGLGTVAMQYPEIAIGQLEHAIRAHGLRGIIVSTSVNGVELADRRYDAFWKKVEELGAVVFIHPIGCAMGERLAPYYFSNVIGNPLETTIALAHMIFSGLLDRRPALRICAAHGGGYFPFYAARFDHGWRVRPEAHTCIRPPGEYLNRLWFDALVYTPEHLEFLVRRAGPSRIVLGTDFPFDMGVSDPIARLDAIGSLSAAERDAIRGRNARELLGI